MLIDPEGKKWLEAEREPVSVDIAEWHEYTVLAQGNHLVHKIDGQMTIDLLDFGAKTQALEGDLSPEPVVHKEIRSREHLPQEHTILQRLHSANRKRSELEHRSEHRTGNKLPSTTNFCGISPCLDEGTWLQPQPLFANCHPSKGRKSN
jgi:hypothetical protein